MPNLAEMGLAANLGIFAVAAVVVWIAGTRMAGIADAISRKTGLGQALLGLLLLGGVTSLPELAVTVTAGVGGNAVLAINNILGGVAMQIAILAVADFAIRRALTSVVPDATLLLQGALNIVLLIVVALAVIVGDVVVGGIGLWSYAILALCIAGMWLLAQADRSRRPWLANREGEAADDDAEVIGHGEAAVDITLETLIIKATVAGACILAAGATVAWTGEAIAEQSGLGSSFVGAVLVAISTSLPEVSTVFAAVRLGLFTMAISDILGTNLFDIGLLFVVDALDPTRAVLDALDTFAAVAALLGALTTALFVVGLCERNDRTVFRLGIDSIAVLFVYLGGLVLLYSLR